MPERRTVEKSKPPEPVEIMVGFTGMGEVKMYGCPVCGRNGQDRKQIEAHMKNHGGEG